MALRAAVAAAPAVARVGAAVRQVLVVAAPEAPEETCPRTAGIECATR